MRQCKYCNGEIKDPLRGNVCRVCKNGLYRYGLDRNQQLSLYESQNKKCALCDAPITMHDREKGKWKLNGCIDHCHTSNKVRGIICHSCNVTLGYIETSITLEKLLNYLK